MAFALMFVYQKFRIHLGILVEDSCTLTVSLDTLSTIPYGTVLQLLAAGHDLCTEFTMPKNKL